MSVVLRRWWAAHRSPDSRLARRLTAAATVLFLLILCAWKPWDLFARGGFSSDFYDAQARAFVHGRLDVAASVAGPEGFLIDGATYLYYGPLLALVRMPFALFGHWADGRLSRASITLGFLTACTLARHLAVAIGASLGRTVSPRRQALLVAAVAASPALSLAGWNSVYHETEMWAFALFLATSVALLRMWATPTRRTVLVAGVLAVCTVLTRSSVGFGALGAVGMVGLLLWHRHRRVAYAAMGAMVSGVAISVAINLAKFGTLFDLPADRQLLSLQDPTRAAWFAGNNGSFFSPRFLPTTVVQYLRPDAIRFERLLPFVRFGPLAPEYGSYPLEGNTPASSLPAAAAALTVLALIGIVVIVRRSAWVPLAIFVGALVAAVPSFMIGFVANRYLVDMLPALVIPAAVALAVVAVPSRPPRRAVVGGALALLVWGAWVNVALATWTQQLKEPGFTELRYDIDDALFGGAPPSVVTMIAGQDVPRDGVVGIDGDCDGLYIAEQGAWAPLERADGVRRLRGMVADENSLVTIVAAGGGDLDLSGVGGSVAVTYVPDSDDRVEGTPVATNGPYSLDVISDPVTGQLEVRIDGTLVLLAYDAPVLADAEVSDTFAVAAPTDGGTPICRSLQARK